ncbi:hypothetical protein, partial [Escherichia coli]|uniref:hypothetical protein n=1 Tax=Escherichia coli TaxID=562 RepID=UPI001411FE68
SKFTKPTDALFFDEELLLPFRVFDTSSSSFLLHQHKPSFPAEPKLVTLQEKPCQSPGEISSASAMINSLELDDDCAQDFDAESMLDEEIEEGIDSIMGTMVEQDTDAKPTMKPRHFFPLHTQTSSQPKHHHHHHHPHADAEAEVASPSH